jgi:hypothetical protein
MPIDYHHEVLRESVTEFSDLIRQRRKLDKKIARLQKMFHWASAHPTDHEISPAIRPSKIKTQIKMIGFTDAVRLVLRNYRIWLTPTLVRDLLPTTGFDSDSYRQLLPSIHVILRRLVASGEALENRLSPCGSVFICASAVADAANADTGADH